MDDQEWTKEQLLEEMKALRARLAVLEQAEDALHESEERCRLIAELTSDYAYTCRVDPDGAIAVEAVTEGFTRVTGYSLEELEARGGWAHLIHPEDFPAARQRHLRNLTGERSVQEFRILTKGGEPRWIRYSSCPTWDETLGRVVGILGAVQDITERKRLEEALRESEDRFHAFMDNSPALAWMKDDQFRKFYANQAWEQHFGRKLGDCRGLTDFDMWPGEVAERLRQNDLAVLAAGKPLEFSESVPDPDGRLRHWAVYKFPFHDLKGKRFVGGMAIDITQRKEAEEQLRDYAGRLQALSRRLLEVQEAERRHLACELHDEIGQYLTGLELTLETGKGLPGEEMRSTLEESQALVQEMVRRVRDLSLRLRPAMLDDLGLVHALLWHFQRYTSQTGVAVAFRQGGIDRRLAPEVETAAYRIVQEALTNVARHAGVKEVTVVVWADSETLRVQVEDRGKGFEVETALASRTSIGLAGMRERALLLEGRLKIESKPGGGTCLTAELPLEGGLNGLQVEGLFPKPTPGE